MSLSCDAGANAFAVAVGDTCVWAPPRPGIYAPFLRGAFDIVTALMRNPDHPDRHYYMASTEAPANSGTVRIGSIRGLPEVLRKLGVDPAEVFEAVGVPRSVFDDGDNRLGYGQFARLVGEAERRSGCEHIGLLVGQSKRLADFGLLARAARCCATAGEALAYFVENFDLHSRATTVTLARDGRYARFAFMICELGIAESRQIQIGSMAVSFMETCSKPSSTTSPSGCCGTRNLACSRSRRRFTSRVRQISRRRSATGRA